MSDNDLMDRLQALDPVSEERAARESRDAWPAVLARTEQQAPSTLSTWRPLARRIVPLLAAAVCVGLVAIALLVVREGPTTGARSADGWISAGTLEDLRRDGVTYLEAWRVFVVAPAGEDPFALSAISPHSWAGYEEPLLYCNPSDTFVEPQHGAKFAVDGSYLVGPSPSGMYTVPLRSDADGNVEIDPTRLLPGASRDQYHDDWTLCPPTARWSAPGFMDVGGSGNDLLDTTIWRSAQDDPIDRTFVSTVPGSNCGFPVAAVLQLTEPLGSEPPDDAAWRYYAADLGGTWAHREDGVYEPTTSLPPGAEFSGYRTPLFELWIDPSTFDREVFVVRVDLSGERVVSRLPRVTDLPRCSPPG